MIDIINNAAITADIHLQTCAILDSLGSFFAMVWEQICSLTQYLNAETFFKWFVDNAGYGFVFLFMVVESSFIPFPSEVVVPPAVYLALTKGDMNVIVIVLLATCGAVVGAAINYVLSLWLGRPIIYKFANSRLGHFFLLDQEKVEKSERYFDKHGAVSTFIGRLIPAVRQLISIPAGLAKMNFAKFLIYTGLGALVWNIILALLGWFLSRTVTLEQLYEKVEQYNSYLTIGGIALLVICLGYMVYKALSAKKSTK